MTKLIFGDARPDGESLAAMRNSSCNFPDTRWAVFQNHDLGSHDLGHLQFLAVGPRNTLKLAPARMPDTQTRFNWRYVIVGFVDLATGEITDQ